jgi:hypothetical protein
MSRKNSLPCYKEPRLASAIECCFIYSVEGWRPAPVAADGPPLAQAEALHSVVRCGQWRASRGMTLLP